MAMAMAMAMENNLYTRGINEDRHSIQVQSKQDLGQNQSKKNTYCKFNEI